MVRDSTVEKMFPKSNLMTVLTIIHSSDIIVGRDLEMSVSPNVIFCTGTECFFDSKLPLQ